MIAALRECEGQLADERFRLFEYLGGSDHSAVFLTDLDQQGSQTAAIKLISASSRTTEVQLARWNLAAKLSHPHLLRLFQTGRCHLADRDLLYVVMEYAQEDLSQVLPERALTQEETHQMLLPLLDALGYLHGQGLVHGHLKPSNIMAADDRLKVSSDRLYRVGEMAGSLGEPTAYDPPEIESAGISAAADVWSLGVSLVETLTQRPPVSNRAEIPPMPKMLPMPFADIVQHCLQRDPQQRWTIGDIKARLQPGSSIIKEEAAVETPKRSSKLRYIAPIAIGVALLAIFALPILRKGSQQLPRTPPTALEHVETKAVPRGVVRGQVVGRVLPDVPQSARYTIRGTVKVIVRLGVDPSGNVTRAVLESPGPSRYFANLALQAAHDWKFKPPTVGGRDVSSEWTLQFQFARSVTKVVPVEADNLPEQ